MRKIATGLVALTMLWGAVPAGATEIAEVTYLIGWVVDEACGKKNANAEGKDCIAECHKNGSPLVFYNKDRDKAYRLEDQKRAAKYVGREMAVLGFITDEGTLKVSSYVEKGTKNSVIGPPDPEPEEPAGDGS